MRQQIKSIFFGSVVLLAAAWAGCSKGENSPSPGGGSGGSTSGGGPSGKDTTCLISAVSQVNSGNGAESSVVVSYNSNNDVTKIMVYDSVAKAKRFEAGFTYVTADSVRIDAYQYLLLDGQKRVVRFVTRGDMTNPSKANHHLFEYHYNTSGYLATKNLFINGSVKANFSTAYTYANGRLMRCIMTSPSAGNKKVLDASLWYNENVTIKNWIYTFPDGIEGYPYLTALNFGKKAVNPLLRVVTRIYNPAIEAEIDTWTTDYGNYKVNAKGYLVSGEATGDLQQGLAAFYGKTNFYYTCH
ncbi:hypothetical protein HRG84_02780 [Flavisolibacter sp. BT320]|nr:hypothetical protein [Flavisolibacter longurius]